MAQRLLSRSSAAREHLRLRLRGRELPDWVDDRIRELGLAPLVVASTDGGRPLDLAPAATPARMRVGA
jgi:hypothetical protein